MQANIFKQSNCLASTLKVDSIGLVVQVRNHIKMYPWRKNRANRESYLDNTKTPYTDKHNINEFMAANRQKKPWQLVIPKDKDARFNAYHWNDSYRSDPKEAKSKAYEKLRSFSKSVTDRGFAREAVAYDPPEDVRERILSIVRSSQLTSSEESFFHGSDEELLNSSLEKRELKVNVIRRCILEFNHELPSSDLNNMLTLRDVVKYFSTPVQGLNPYSTLLRQADQLPTNIHLIPDAIRYDRENDTKFGGVSAYPGLLNKVPGLRASKQYPTLNQDEFQWPDV